MNIILFEPDEPLEALPLKDPRARHIVQVLRMGVGDSLFVGRVNGLRGKASIEAIDKDSLRLAVEWEKAIEPLRPVALIVGLCRPQTARKILLETTALGVSQICFFQSMRGEKAYAQSTLWTTDEWRRRLVEGAQQAFHTLLPAVEHAGHLQEALEKTQAHFPDWQPVALDNYEATDRLSQRFTATAGGVLIVGSERGWQSAERDALRSSGVPLAHLGERVLRTETACVVGLSLMLGNLGHV